MKWFWYSLVIFCLLMCSCRSKKLDTHTDFKSNYSENAEWVRFSSLADTFCTFRIKIDKSKLRITETLTIVEYDKKSGKPNKKTDAKREIAQDTDEVASQEVQGGSEIHQGDSVNHFADVSKKVESKTEEESKDSTESFWKWFGIVLGLLIGVTIFVRSRK